MLQAWRLGNSEQVLLPRILFLVTKLSPYYDRYGEDWIGGMTMNMPRFTAEAVLYKTSGHYRTGRQAINLSAEMIRPIHPAREVIEIHSCPPGWSDIGGTCWPDPLMEPGGGSSEPGTPGVPGETGEGGRPGGGGGNGGVPLDKDAPIPELGNCSARQIQSKAATPCQKKIEEDLMNNVKNRHYFECTGKRRGRVQHPKMQCCQQKGDDVIVCDDLN